MLRWGLGLEQKPKEFALEYAGFWIRFGAHVIDLAILLFVSWIVAQVFLALCHCPSTDVVNPLSGGINISCSLILFSVIGVINWMIEIAFFVSFWAWRGQTPGKMAVGIKVIRTDSSPITWHYALLRYVGYIVSALTLGIGFIWIAFDSRKQGIHDKIADTYVVKLPVRQVAFTEPPVRYARGGVG